MLDIKTLNKKGVKGLKNVKYISLISENMFEIKGKTIEKKDVVQVINSDTSVVFELDMTRVFFTNEVMNKVVDIEDILLHEEITHVRYWFEDGSMALIPLYETEQSRIKQQQKIYISISCDTTKLLEV